jgi:hypothetical protein
MVMAECKVVHQEVQEEQDGIQMAKMEMTITKITNLIISQVESPL